LTFDASLQGDRRLDSNLESTGGYCVWGPLMMRRAVALAAVLTATLSWLEPARGAEDVSNAPGLIQALCERGYYDLTGEYLERLRQQPDLSAGFRAMIDYKPGRILLDEAAKTSDLIRRKELLEQVRGKLEMFTKANPNHELVPEALVQLVRLLVERGHLAVLLGEETEDKAEKNAKLAEACGSFDQARIAYGQADERLQAKYKTFPPFILDDDPRKEKRDRVHTALRDAQLQKAIVDYEEGQTYPLGSKERTDLLDKALAQFEDLYKRYWTQFAGLTARMWQAECYEERGDLGPAMGNYKRVEGARRPQAQAAPAARQLLPDRPARQVQGVSAGGPRGDQLAQGVLIQRRASLQGGPRSPVRTGQGPPGAGSRHRE
jgi:cellulose synthase operon protein C